MADEARTKPPLDTILERINVLGTETRDGFARVERKLDDFDIRLDRIESDVNKTRSEMLTLRADFKELRAEFTEFRSQFKQPA